MESWLPTLLPKFCIRIFAILRLGIDSAIACIEQTYICAAFKIVSYWAHSHSSSWQGLHWKKMSVVDTEDETVVEGCVTEGEAQRAAFKQN